MGYLLKIDGWSDLLIPAIFLLFWIGGILWKLREKLFVRNQVEEEETETDETEWNFEPDGEAEESPTASFEAFLAEAAAKGIRIGHAPAAEVLPAPIPAEAATAPDIPAPIAPPSTMQSYRKRSGRAADHPIAAAVRARPQQSIVLAEVLGKPKALR